jgi:hypothetical protein
MAQLAALTTSLPTPWTDDASGALAYCWQEQPDVGNLAGGCGRRPEIRENLS